MWVYLNKKNAYATTFFLNLMKQKCVLWPKLTRFTISSQVSIHKLLQLRRNGISANVYWYLIIICIQPMFNISQRAHLKKVRY